MNIQNEMMNGRCATNLTQDLSMEKTAASMRLYIYVCETYRRYLNYEEQELFCDLYKRGLSVSQVAINMGINVNEVEKRKRSLLKNIKINLKLLRRLRMF